MKHHRLNEKDLTRTQYWADSIAEYLIQKYPKRNVYVCATGISPSGPIHFGNFRDVITAYAVTHALIRRGKKSKCIFSFDNYDRFRKVPSGVDSKYEEFIGKPLSDTPSPNNPSISYATEHQDEFKKSMENLNIKMHYREQTHLYKSGIYTEEIIHAMQQREKIAKILLAHMTDKGKEIKGISEEKYIQDFYPISVYSQFTGKDATKILSYDGDSTITYRCLITKKEATINIRDECIVKLQWKVDWAMRWKHENVCFEPAGSDHAAPDGSYDVASVIAKEIYDYEPPAFIEYGFVGLQGLSSKMSGSRGSTITPNQLLTIYEPTVLLWMYLRRLPSQTFSLSFGTEVFRQYDEMDSFLSAYKSRSSFVRYILSKVKTKTAETYIAETLEDLHKDHMYSNPLSFRQIVGLGQLTTWDIDKLVNIVHQMNHKIDSRSVTNRMHLAKEWLEKYHPEEMITLNTSFNNEAWNTLTEKEKEYILRLQNFFENTHSPSIKTIETFLYDIPKTDHTKQADLKQAQKKMFQKIYLLLINKTKGPRLGTFLWSINKKDILKLLTPTE